MLWYIPHQTWHPITEFLWKSSRSNRIGYSRNYFNKCLNLRREYAVNSGTYFGDKSICSRLPSLVNITITSIANSNGWFMYNSSHSCSIFKGKWKWKEITGELIIVQSQLWLARTSRRISFDWFHQLPVAIVRPEAVNGPPGRYCGHRIFPFSNSVHKTRLLGVNFSTWTAYIKCPKVTSIKLQRICCCKNIYKALYNKIPTYFYLVFFSAWEISFI